MIVFSAFQVFQVFTSVKKPYPLFRFSGISIDFGKIIGQQAMNALPEGMEMPEGIDLSSFIQQNQPGSTNEVQEIISADMVNMPMNLFAHVLLMGFIAGSGLKVATIGTYLVRTIEVKVNQKTP